MNAFWNTWVITLTVLFLAIMVGVILFYWQKRASSDPHRTLDTFDGIQENDGAVPKLLFIAYLISIILTLGYFVLYPGLGNWPGLMHWSSTSQATVPSQTTLEAQYQKAKLSAASPLEELSQNATIVNTGQSLFQTHCAACHGDQGQGQKHFPNLLDNYWLYGGTDQDILHSIKQGRNGVMAGWENILTSEQITHVSQYIASLEPDRVINAPEVNFELGSAIYTENCVACHGEKAQGNPILGAPNLADNIWLHGGSIDEIKHTIRQGLNNVMPAFQSQLNPLEISAIAAYVKYENKLHIERKQSLDPELIAKGRYLALAGDCIACHTSEGGQPFGGGLGFVTPFGTLYSTNISTHPDYGIGDYTYQDFYDSLHKGKGKNGYLYPAMPYSSYQYVTEEDTRAIWTYLQSIVSVNTVNTENKMIFPSNIRLGLLAWNIAFLDTNPLEYPSYRPATWKRGKYLTMGLGHCSECHTPRNIAQALEPKKLFQGNLIDGWQAPDITAEQLYETGWNIVSLTDFLKTGHSEKGTAFGGMAEVVKNSTRHLTRQDVEAIAEYLIAGDKYNEIEPHIVPIIPPGFGDLANRPVTQTINEIDDSLNVASDTKTGIETLDIQNHEEAMYNLYAQTCGACHGPDGKGRAGIAPALLNNGIIMHKDPYDTIAVAIRGLMPSYMNRGTNFMPMSSFNTVLSDAQLAQLLTFVRNRLGGRTVIITAKDVTSVRKELEKSGYIGAIHQPME
ncbi:cytochrome-c oxidase, cbb3-type subunit III [Photobacterium damselae subsp. damselae]|uniref:cytochrome-c oxidase, cbb3-type subunit III n=1 Tax=Photobacterium damselae TaxID=38293 RepID=UPI00311B01F2